MTKDRVIFKLIPDDPQKGQVIAFLWEAGLVPTWDGSVWRLHTGADAHIVYEWKPEEK